VVGDETVQPKSGHQKGAEVGYHRGKPGWRSIHPLLVMVAQPRLRPAYRIRAGDTVKATDWQESMENAQRWLGERGCGSTGAISAWATMR
jgi:hypothetical protein